MSDIEHHAQRGGLDATLGYNEFAAPTSSGRAALAYCGDCRSKGACNPAAEGCNPAAEVLSISVEDDNQPRPHRPLGLEPLGPSAGLTLVGETREAGAPARPTRWPASEVARSA
jgi:hypothetical protein